MGGGGGCARGAWRNRRWSALPWALVLWLGVAALHGTAGAGGPVRDSWIVVDTKTHTLSVFRGDAIVDRFHNIAIGRGGFSLDRMRGDGTTPLGTFHIDRIRPSSRFVLFFGIDFPRPEHARRALDEGRIDAHDYQRIVAAFARDESPPQDTPLGGQLGIHGLGGGSKRVHDTLDWTQGCIALTNTQIKRLSRWIHLGMRVEVR
jgi:murein L,D-transpeptidase YafK